MLNQIIAFSIRQKVIIGFITLLLVAFGSFYITKLPIDAVPDITNNQVQVITVSPSLGAPDVERLITYQVELACSNIPDLIEMRSFSRFGLSLVTLIFKDGKDIYLARQQVAERLITAKQNIPAEIGNPELGPVTSGLGEIYQYVVRPLPGYETKYSVTDLRTIQDWIVRRQLLGVEGVADVSSFGGKLKQYEVAVDAFKLQSYNISISDVFNALNQNNQNTGGAYIEKGPNVLFIRTDGLAKSISDIENITIKNLANGSPLLIKDVANVGYGHAIRYGAMVFNNTGEVAGAVVMMLKGANSNEVIKRVKTRMEQIKKTLPEGITVEPFLDRTKMVNNAINTVKTNLLEGALIVVFVLVLFLGNIRAGFLVASVIPLSMLFAVCMMHVFGVSGNLMSLGALDFGLIVDGAVIIVEAVMHTLQKGGLLTVNGLTLHDKMNELVKSESQKLLNSTVFAQMIILIVYLPIFTLEGIEGKMFIPMAQTVSFALIGAFILSLTYVPMMASLTLKPPKANHVTFSEKLINQLTAWFLPKLSKALSYPKTVLITTLVLFATAMLLFTQIGGEFIPKLEEGDFAIDTRVLTGSNLNVSIQTAKNAADILINHFPEVEKVVSKIGSGEIPTDPMPIEAQDLMVILKDKKEWTSANNFNELAEKMSEKLSVISGATFGFQYPVQMRFNELMTGARQDVVCKIFGEDLELLSLYAAKLGKIAASVNGAKDIWVEPIGGMPQIVITHNRKALAQFGVTINSINDAINTAFAGKQAGNIYEGEKRFSLIVRLQNDYRTNLTHISNLLIPTQSGKQIPLYQLASVELIDGPNQIQHEDGKRRIMVGFNVRGRDISSVVQELQTKTEKSLKMNPGYFITYGGAFENLEQAKKRLMIAVPAALFLILFLLFLAFGKIKPALLIYSAIPLSATGGVLALFARGMPFSISAGVGFIALFGVAVLNGIVLIAEFNRQLKTSDTLKEAIMQGTANRLRPVLMTATVASLGFLPMAISNGAGAEVQRPLATVVIGGLLIATLLTLVVLPVLYAYFYKASENKTPLTVVAVLFFIIINNNTHAQSLTYQAALDSALQYNKLIKEKQLLVQQKETYAKAAWRLPKTNIDGEYGQFNSFYNDNRISIKQQFNFPTVYIRNKKWLTSETITAKSLADISINEVKRSIGELFIHAKFLQQKMQLLILVDSIYNKAVNISNLYLKSGTTNLPDQILVQNQSVQVNQQLELVKTDLNNLKLQLQWLCGTQLVYDFNIPNELIELKANINQNTPAGNLLVVNAIAKEQSAKAKYKLTASALLPELMLGYNNLTIYGFGNDGLFYDYRTRFNVVTAGLAIPLFAGAYQKEIKADKIGYAAAQQNSLYTSQMIFSKWQQTIARYNQLVKNNQNYIPITKQANEMIRLAGLQLNAGEINYLNYVFLVNNAIEILNNHIQIILQLNQSILELNTLCNQF
jgi:cobalt-zinc-cadmium resistance protein CzcA